MVYMFLAEGFEETEALCPLDILRRAGIDVKTVGVGGKSITGSHKITVQADISDAEYADEKPEMVILPGGMPGTLNLEASETVKKAVNAAAQNGTFVAAICAAPSVIGKMGLLKGKKATCYPGYEKYLACAEISEKKVVRDGNFITGAGMGVALEFGLELTMVLAGKAAAEKIRNGIIAK